MYMQEHDNALPHR